MADRTCFQCVQRIEIPGNCHIACGNWLAQPTLRTWRGCGLWPLAFDAAIVGACPGWTDNPAERIPLPESPELNLLRLLVAAGRL